MTEAYKQIRVSHSRRFAEALDEHEVAVTLKLYEGVNHTRIIGSMAAPLRFLNDSYDDTKAFLEQYGLRAAQ